MNLQPNRDLMLLNDKFRSKVQKWLVSCPEIFVTEAYRSQERQNFLYAQWRYKPYQNKPKVTWTVNGNHTKGIAVDIAFKWPILYPTSPSVRRKVADKAIEFWIDRGYDLRNIDKPHFQENPDKSWTGDQLLAVDVARASLWPVRDKVEEMRAVTNARVRKAKDLWLTR